MWRACVCMRFFGVITTRLSRAEEDGDGRVQQRGVVDAPAEGGALHGVGDAGERAVCVRVCGSGEGEQTDPFEA